MTELQSKYKFAVEQWREWHNVYRVKIHYYRRRHLLHWWYHGQMLSMRAHEENVPQLSYLKTILDNNPLYYGDHRDTVIASFVMQAKFRNLTLIRNELAKALKAAGEFVPMKEL